jgi:LysR family transcriptional regulator, carnitine catabolism transcriptional activator
LLSVTYEGAEQIMSLQLSLRQLEIFVRVAELRSFSEAGKMLHVSQPALTRSIQQMEDSLGARLFDRDTRKVELAAVGVRLMPIARRILSEFESACGEMAQFVEGLQGKVHVAALPCVAAALLPSVIARFRKSHPNVDFRISECLSQNVAEAVTDGICDFGIAVLPTENERVDCQHLIDDDIFMVCRDDDPLVSEKCVPWSVFTTRTFIALGRNCSVRATTQDTFRELNLDIKPHYECQNIATARSLVETGLGICAVSGLMLPQIAFGNVVGRRLIQPSRSRSMGVITRSGRQLAPAAQAFFETFVSHAVQIHRKIVSGGDKLGVKNRN